MKQHARYVLSILSFAALTLGAAPAFAQSDEHNAGEPAAHTEQAGEPAGGEHADGEHAEHAEHEPEPINWTSWGGTRTVHGETRPNPPPFSATIVNFLILAALIGYAVRKVINPALADRRTAMESELNESHRLLAEAKTMHEEYSARIAKMDDEFKSMREEFVKAGQAEFERIVAEANAKAERLKDEAEATIAQELRALRADLRAEAVDAAVASAEKAVRGQINAQDQSRLADDYVARIEGDSKSEGAAA